MKTPLLLLGLALACALWAPAAEASTIIRAPNNLSIARGLVGWWNFDGKTVSGTRVFDASGTGNYGTMTNGPVLTEGKLGQAMQFDGSGAHVTGSDTGLPSGSAPRTLSAWIKTRGLPNDPVIMGYGNPGQANQWCGLQVLGSSGVVRLGLWSNDVVGTVAVNDNVWHHVAAVLNGSTLAWIYIDGKLDTQGTITTPGTVLNGQFLIGTSFGSHFLGPIDDVRIYNRALSADEIKRLYKMGATAKLGVVSNSTSLDKGLVGWWNFDGKSVAGTRVFDASGNGNYGTMTNGPVLTEGKLGQAMSFDGGDDYVNVPHNSSLDFGANQNFTVAAWVKTSQPMVSNVWPGVVVKENDDGSTRQGYGIELHTSNTSAPWYFFIFVSGSNLSVDGASDIADGIWHHVVGIRRGSNIESYQDGVFANRAAASSGSVAKNQSLLLGARGASGIGVDMFNGLLDDVRVYNRALSADEVKRLYNMGATNKLGVVSNSTSLDKGLVGWWNFDGKTVSGTRVFDASGKGNYSTMTNGPVLTEGKLGQGMRFDGDNDYVEVPFHSSVNPSSAVSACAWAKRTGAGDDVDYQILVGTQNWPNSGYELALSPEASGAIWRVLSAGSGSTHDVSATNITTSDWHHYCGSFGSGTTSLYVDGVLRDSKSASMVANGSVSLVLGKEGVFNNGISQGFLDDVRIYNRALSADEIKRLYNMGR